MNDPNQLIPQQDPEERRAIRHEYRELLQEADGKFTKFFRGWHVNRNENVFSVNCV